ncbi:MAG: stage II sporulation protein M [Heliobacteriaceae bacterium]|nr:stage II sporulation protein M [Heliobacteriaceae bacterium]MDD4587291.1 stage II sporulation protein M [Heliobacteriaceae bacterium]
MLAALEQLWRHHLQAHWRYYILVAGVIAAGIAGGTLAAKMLPTGQVVELQARLGEAFYGLAGGVNYQSLANFAVLRNLQAVGLVLFLGLTVIGLPFILAFLFFRGFALGFTVGFLMLSRPNDGLLIVLLGLVPPSLVFLPGLVVAGVVALAFSLWLVKGRSTERVSLSSALVVYCGVGFGTLALAFFAGLLDAYVAPWLLRLCY